MLSEKPRPASATLVYDIIPGNIFSFSNVGGSWYKERAEFNVLIADSITHFGQITFPGGRAEKGENPRRCALRELLEETSLVPTSPRSIISVFEKPALVETADGLYALSLFLLNFRNTNMKLLVPESEYQKVFVWRFVPSIIFYQYVLQGRISPLILGGNWEARIAHDIYVQK